MCLAAVAVAAAIAIGAAVHKASRKQRESEKHRPSITPFHVFLIGFFVAAVIVFFPIELNISASSGFAAGIKSLLLSVLDTMQIFFLNGSFDKAETATAGFGGIGTAYTVIASVLHVVAPVLTFGFILSFFRESIAMLKYKLHPFSDVYILSELNEGSIELARDILSERGKCRRQVVFTDVFEKDDEAIFELVAEAKRLGAICLKKDITELGLKRARINRKLFFIGNNEDENIRQALTMINRCRETPRYNNYNTQFFVFASTAESEALLDAADNGAMKVRRINERHNLVLHTLYEHSVFDTAIEKKGVKHINAVIVGLGTYGTELLKILCWLCQMPGYELTVHVFDKTNGEDKIKTIAPELWAKNKKRVNGEPYYNIDFRNNVDISSSAFADNISALDDVTTAFVTLGTDEQNIETAMRLRTLFARKNITAVKPFPPIYTVVYSALKNKTVSRNGGLMGIDESGEGYDIEFIGNISTRYSMHVIEQAELEKAGMECHMRWAAETNRLEKIAQYEKYEYYRKSSIAESVHSYYMRKLGAFKTDENGNPTRETAVYEHNRWSAYMRTNGYIGNKQNVKNHIGKTHYDLVPYDEMPEHEQIKDAAVKSE